MGKSQRDKGNRVERKIVKRLNRCHNFIAERVPLSGGCGGSYIGDLTLEVYDHGVAGVYVGEVKSRADGFRSLRKWLENASLLFLAPDREEPLVVMRMGLFEMLVGGGEYDHDQESNGFGNGLHAVGEGISTPPKADVEDE